MTEAGTADRETAGSTLAAGVPTDALRLPAHFSVEPELRDQLSGLPGHQRCVEGAGELLLVAHEVPGATGSDRRALFFWKRYDGCWTQAGGPGIDELGGLLERYAGVIGSHARTLNRGAGAEVLPTILRHAARLLRSMRNLLQAIEQTLAIDPEDREIRAYRDRAREIERAADLLLADARATLESGVFERTSAQAAALERLARSGWHGSLLLAFFLPMIAFGGLFELPVALPVGAGCGVVLVWLLARASATGKNR